MVLESSQVLNCPSAKAEAPCSKDELQQKLYQLLSMQGIDTNNIPLTSAGTIDISSIPGMKLHTLMLRAEEMGLNIKFTKKTVVEIG